MAGNVVRDKDIPQDRLVDEHPQNFLSRLIMLVGGIVLLLLAFRFTLSLLGANSNNAIVDFVYDITQPLVSPFIDLFNFTNIDYGVSKFELYTLIAMMVYAAAAWGLAALVNIAHR